MTSWWSRYATAFGALSCMIVTVGLLVPWYGVNYCFFFGSECDHRVEYSPGIDALGNTMPFVTIVLGLSLAASAIATVLAFKGRVAPGVIAGLMSAGLLLAAGIAFSIGITEELHLDRFSGVTMLNRSTTAEAAPMLGWWVAVFGAAAPAALVITLARAGSEGSGGEGTGGPAWP